MLSGYFRWAGNNVAKTAVVWFSILSVVFFLAYPAYYAVVIGVVLAGIPLYIKDRELRYQAIGFFIALAGSYYLLAYLLGPVQWWSIFGL